MKVRSYLLAYCGVIISLLLLFGFSTTLPPSEHRNLLLKEAGMVEVLSALLHFTCLVFLLFKGGWRFVRKYYYVVLLSLIFGFRELDFDKQFTTMGIFKSRFFVSDEVPIHEKLVGIAVVLVLLLIVFLIIKNHAKSLWVGLRKGSPIAVGAILTLALIVVSKGLDGLGGKAKSLGIDLPNLMDGNYSALEEILELGIPIIMIIMFIYYFGNVAIRQRNTPHKLPPDDPALPSGRV